jgi:hypothetical protein
VLYDSIPLRDRKDTGIINVPICVIFIAPNRIGINDIYLFFNKNASETDMTMAVKLLLGIKPETEFTLNPPITTTTPAPAPTWYKTKQYQRLQGFLGNTLVKLTACGLGKGGVNTYCIETGTFNGDTELDKIKTTRHNIKTTDKSYESLDTEKIKKFLADKSENGFKARVLDSKMVLPELYKKYFVLYDTNKPAVDEAEIEKLFGADISPEKPDWNLHNRYPKEEWTDESYPNFRRKMMDRIREAILDKKTQSRFGLRGEEVDKVKTRPLNITTSMPVEYEELEVQEIIQCISRIASSSRFTFNIDFTELWEDWMGELEEDDYKKSLDDVQKAKRGRIDPCVYRPESRDCQGAAFS